MPSFRWSSGAVVYASAFFAPELDSVDYKIVNKKLRERALDRQRSVVRQDRSLDPSMKRAVPSSSRAIAASFLFQGHAILAGRSFMGALHGHNVIFMCNGPGHFGYEPARSTIDTIDTANPDVNVPVLERQDNLGKARSGRAILNIGSDSDTIGMA